ncbi:MAG: hypothetical protein MJZ18_05505, partial [Bacteroidales bacterium]|nr:hypothetical protein [Bacteroidales bacterium]
MFVHYLKIAFRNLAKYRLQTVICLIGLSVGMTCFALSSLWFSYISSFEDFVEDADRTYLLSEGSAKFQPDCADYGIRDAIAEKIEALKKYCPEIDPKKLKQKKKKKVTSYKYFWFLSLITLLKEKEELSISFQ